MHDPEYDLYYLQSRYYDPQIGRFLNADAFASTGQGVLGNNMFAYCNNNPVMFVDATGMFLKRNSFDDTSDPTEKWEYLSVGFLLAGCYLSAELMIMALSDNPSDYYAGLGSYASNQAASNSNFTNKVLRHYNDNCDENGYGAAQNIDYTFAFSCGDLGLALHRVQYSYYTIGEIGERPSHLLVTITDTYDYTEFENPFKQKSFLAGLAWLANDMAALDSAAGYLNPFDVTIVLIVPIK